MHQLVPPFILRNYAEGNTTGSLPAAGLFVDTSGFSAMTDALMAHGQHGAEVLAGVMSATFEPLIRSVFEQGGFVTSQEGDSFTALFPIDANPAKSAFHALAAAWQIQKIVNRQAKFITPYGEFHIVVKVGLSLGVARWGIITSARQHRAAYYFRGQAVEECVEAEHLAQAGEIILTEAIYQQVQHLVEVDKQGSHFWLQNVLEEPSPYPSFIQPE
ncbi:MAG: adenylate/guanylate cyclase domain-containing protein, partial [Anaerolineaceae bacterium]|nr:adenylate/guanylate cyclase domain-containing protein [Anaerolineaceae bacterium]